MSLIDCMTESFVLMDPVRTSDGAGGFTTSWNESVTFKAAQQHDTTIEAQAAEKAGTASTYTFLPPKTITLKYHDVIKRISDGQIFRITQPTGEQYTPSISNLNLGLCKAEKWSLT